MDLSLSILNIYPPAESYRIKINITIRILIEDFKTKKLNPYKIRKLSFFVKCKTFTIQYYKEYLTKQFLGRTKFQAKVQQPMSWKWHKLSIENLGLGGKRIVLRTDFNVPLRKGKVADNKKIIAGLDSIVYTLVKEAKSVVILSHLGRPRGTQNLRYSLTSVAEELEKLLKQAHQNPKELGKYSQFYKLFSASHNPPNVRFISNFVGSEVEEFVKDPPHGSVYLVENLKFHLEEEGHGEDTTGNKVIASSAAITKFKKSLRKLGDIFINDAFSIAHTTNSSIMGEGFELRAAGLLMTKELRYFKKALHRPERPYLAILGGVKVIEKLHMIDNLLEKVTEVIIAGAMAFPFLKNLKRMKTGHSLFDKEGSKVVKMIMKKVRKNDIKVHFPVDFITGSRLGAVRIETVKSGIEDEWMGLDIGPQSCTIFQEIISRAKLIIWNGPVGAYELENFESGTESVLLDVAKATSRGATTIIVGEDTAACASKWRMESKVSHISTGNDSAKDLLRGKLLPGIASLSSSRDENQLIYPINRI